MRALERVVLAGGNFVLGEASEIFQHVRRNSHLCLGLFVARQHADGYVVKPLHFLVCRHTGASCWRERLAHDASKDDRCSISSSNGPQACSLSTLAMS